MPYRVPSAPFHWVRPPASGFWILLILALPIGILRGQESSTSTSTPVGFEISSVSGYVVYYSTGLPEGNAQPTTPVPSDVGLGGSVRMDWTHVREKSRIMFTYAPSYTGRLRFAAWNALNHSASFNASKQSGRWSLGFSVAGNLSNLSEFLFSPTVFANVAAVPATFDDLAAALLTGSVTNAQLASLLTGAPLVESPARNLFFGERMFTSAGQASLKYAPSPRLGIQFTGSASRSQHLSDNLPGTAQNGYLIPRTSTVGASLDISYSHSPRTQLSASVNSSRIVSTIQDSYTTMATVSLGRKMGRRWFLQFSGGAGKMIPVRSTLVLKTGLQPVVNTGLGFRALAHTFLASYSRAVSDSYGLGAATTSSVTGSWRWARPGRSWWTETSVSWQRLIGGTFGSTSGLQTEGGFGKSLTNHMALLTQCVFLHYSQQLTSIPPLSQTALRVSIIWNPQPRTVQ